MDVGRLSRELAELSLSCCAAAPAMPVNVRRLRESLGLTQLQYATRFGLDLDAVQNWEQDLTRPDRNARTLLRSIATAPNAVEGALAGITRENLPAGFDDAPIGREAL